MKSNSTQRAMDFTPMWLSNSCCDDECACVANHGCPCTHDCQCPDSSLPHTFLSLSSDSLAIKLHKYTRSSESNTIIKLPNVKLEGGSWQEPTQVGYFESDEPGIDEREDAVDAGSLRKGGGAVWARAEGLVESGDWKHPKHCIKCFHLVKNPATDDLKETSRTSAR